MTIYITKHNNFDTCSIVNYEDHGFCVTRDGMLFIEHARSEIGSMIKSSAFEYFSNMLDNAESDCDGRYFESTDTIEMLEDWIRVQYASDKLKETRLKDYNKKVIILNSNKGYGEAFDDTWVLLGVNEDNTFVIITATDVLECATVEDMFELIDAHGIAIEQ